MANFGTIKNTPTRAHVISLGNNFKTILLRSSKCFAACRSIPNSEAEYEISVKGKMKSQTGAELRIFISKVVDFGNISAEK